MFIKGFIHQKEDEAFFGNVYIVDDIRFCVGEYVGYMELSNSDEIVIVKQHPFFKTFSGQIIKEGDI